MHIIKMEKIKYNLLRVKMVSCKGIVVFKRANSANPVGGRLDIFKEFTHKLGVSILHCNPSFPQFFGKI